MTVRSQPWLSVIVPSHNGERWLGAALTSVVEQAQEGIEVIVVDSSESKKVQQIIDGFRGPLDIHFHSRPDLIGWTAKTNFGVSQATAEQICMLHQDDLWLPDRCTALRRWLVDAPNAVMHLHPVYIVDESGRRLGQWRCPLPADGGPLPADLLLERLLVQEFVAVPAPTISRKAFLAVGGMDEELLQTADWDLYLKLARFGEVYYHSKLLACFRIHKYSQTVASSRNPSDYRTQLEAVFDRHCNLLTPRSREAVLPLAIASINVNAALAAANNGDLIAVAKALGSLVLLGPVGIWHYLCYSRLIERLFPRVKARLTGAF